MKKETKYAGGLKKVKIHPIGKSLDELATIGLRLDPEQTKELHLMLGKAIDQHAQQVVITAHRRDGHVTLLYS